MTYTGTVGTALKLDDKDVNDPNSGFYTAQATTEQINNIPTDAKEAGELLYNKTTGKLVLYNGIAGGWETVNSSEGFNGNVIISSYPTAPTDPVEGEVYYNTTTNTYQVYTDGAWQDITTSDTEIVVRSHATDPTPVEAGLIYYNTVYNQLRAQNNTTTNTIVTTPDVNGNYIVQSHATDPSSHVNGQLYYNTTDNILKTYTNAAWSYLEKCYAAYNATVCTLLGNSIITATPISPAAKLFTISNNGTITYTGTNSISASVAGQISFQAANNATLNFALRRNGVMLDILLLYTNVSFEAGANMVHSVAINTFIDLQPGDYLNVICTASPTTTITIYTISLKVESL